MRRSGPAGTRRTASRPMPVACAILSQARWLSADAYMTGRPSTARSPFSPYSGHVLVSASSTAVKFASAPPLVNDPATASSG